MNKVEAIIRPERLSAVIAALAADGFAGLNVANVTGRGEQRGIAHAGRAGEADGVVMLQRGTRELGGGGCVIGVGGARAWGVAERSVSVGCVPRLGEGFAVGFVRLVSVQVELLEQVLGLVNRKIWDARHCSLA